MPKFEVGDNVRLTIKDRCYLNGFQDNDICIIRNTNCGGRKEYQIKLLQGANIGYAMEDELELATPRRKRPMDIVTQQVLADIKTPIYIDKLDEQIEIYKETFSKEGENYMKILEIYKERTLKEIENNYDKLIKDVLAEDNVQKIIEETENQLNVLLDRPEERKISLGCEYLFEPKTQEKIEKLKEKRKQEKDIVEKLIEEVRARLEICDDNETSKVAVLKEYEILDKDGKIAEYKIKKKGRI